MVETISALLEDGGRPFTADGTTIGEIASLAAGIRETLTRRGAAADKPVCLCVEERHHLLAAIIAAWAGAPPLIIPPAFHPELLREVQSTKPYGFILTDTEIAPAHDTAVVSIRECGRGEHPPTLIRRPESPFLWLFTGGSTGTPRVWSKTPGNLFGESFHLARVFGIGPDDLILSTAPPQHIYGLLASVLLPFVASARVVRHTCTFPREILAALEKERATVLVSVPIHYAALGNDALERFTLRLALSSAAPLDPADAAFFLEKTGVAINEIYGSTETGGMATRVHGADHGSWEPFDCLDWRILSERLSVRSDFVSPDLPLDADGYYLTADRVAAAGESRFRFLGRADHIVKIGGKRVDLEEIREEIRRIPGVKDACVSIVPQGHSRRFRVGALVATERATAEIRDALRSLEEHHGLVRRVRVVRSIPMLPNGKIDRLRVDRLLSASAPAGPEGEITADPARRDPAAQ